MIFAIDRIRKITSELRELILSDPIHLELKMKRCGYGAYNLLEEDGSGWGTYDPHQTYRNIDGHCWFKTACTMPEAFEGKTVVFRVDFPRRSDLQFMIFVNGRLVQGLDENHRDIRLADSAKAGDTYRIDLYTYTGMREGPIELSAAIFVLHPDIEKLYYDVTVPLGVAEQLDENDKRRVDLLNCLVDAVNLLDLRKVYSESFFSSVEAAVSLLEKELYGKLCGHEDVIETCVGHTHIDVAWLWTLAQTREKAVRSFSTVLNLMKQYPDYVFMSSQPQLYEFVKEDRPELFEQIRQMVKAGRWEAEGAMWLEADCNLTSGESLVRQILFGKRFFKKEFGVDSRILWLPDVFGYSAALPQILKKSGVDYFMTTKISWSEFNKMPYDTFRWKGIDGTEILTHFITTTDYRKDGRTGNGTTYNGNINPSQVMGCWQRYQQKELSSEVLNSFGYGDGGGGPTSEMLENAARLERGIPGSPKVRLGRALDFFKRLEKNVDGNKRLPKWVGELYLEFHRGTYTAMARNKAYNRKTEFLNQEAELFNTVNHALDCRAGYPQQALNACWKTTLLNQFHDILPGSSIKPVYEDSKAQYETINAQCREMVSSALRGIVSHIRAEETSLAVFNQLGFDRSDAVRFALPEGWRFAQVFDGDRALETQLTADGHVIFFAEHIPSKGYKTFRLRRAEPAAPSGMLTASVERLENPFFRILLDRQGHFVSVYDKKAGREVLKPGERGNVLQAFEDKPRGFDAWNIDIYYQEKMWEVGGVDDIRVVENGPVRAGLRITRKFLDSTIEQTIYIYRDIPRIDFANTVDWKERQILLKVAFPVDIHADKATYEIQFGNVERPTHWNTSWDWARFEVCAHKWADLSEGNYGVSLLNDCKYGYDIRDSVMRLTLLTSSIEPNVDADREVHHFVYSLYPHSGDWRTGGVVQEAYDLNCPLYAVPFQAQEGDLPGKFSFVSLEGGNVMLETVKKAEDDEGVILRLYEYKNERSKARVLCGLPIVSAAECDLMENEIAPVECRDNAFSFEMKPYEIKTFKVRLKGAKA